MIGSKGSKRSMASSTSVTEEAKVPLLEDSASIVPVKEELGRECEEDGVFSRRVWNESKKLWQIVGPAIFSRVSTYIMFIISQAFAGHLGDLDLAAMSIASNVILGIDIGLMVLCVLYVSLIWAFNVNKEIHLS